MKVTTTKSRQANSQLKNKAILIATECAEKPYNAGVDGAMANAFTLVVSRDNNLYVVGDISIT